MNLAHRIVILCLPAHIILPGGDIVPYVGIRNIISYGQGRREEEGWGAVLYTFTGTGRRDDEGSPVTPGHRFCFYWITRGGGHGVNAGGQGVEEIIAPYYGRMYAGR